MKKKMIALAVLVFAVAITSYSVSGTYAKYTTDSGNWTDTARVAKWGIKWGQSVGGTLNLFAPQYGDATHYEIQSTGGSDDVIAPGAKGNASFGLTLEGAPEVAFELKSVVKVIDKTGQLKFALVGPDSKLISDGGKNGQSFVDQLDNYELTASTLETTLAKALAGHNGDSNSGFEDKSGDDTASNASQKFAPNSSLSTVVGNYTIYWMWDFDASGSGTNDKQDTNLGNGVDKESGSGGENYTDQAGEAATVEVQVTATQLSDYSAVTP